MAFNGVGKLRVLIMEGDELVRRRLRALLRTIEPSVDVEEAATAPQASRRIDEVRPDLVLLDIDLPGVTAIEALRGANGPCLLVMTAHPELTLPAFDLEALDCLVKPVLRERLVLGLRRVRRRVAERHIATLALEIAGTAAVIGNDAREEPGGAQSRYPDQLTIRVRRRMFALSIADIVWIEGASQYSRVHARSGEYLLSRSLNSLECELNPSRFFRIHRSAIVNAACVREVMSRGDGRYNVYLHGGKALPMGRARREILGRLLAGMGGPGNAVPDRGTVDSTKAALGAKSGPGTPLSSRFP